VENHPHQGGGGEGGGRIDNDIVMVDDVLFVLGGGGGGGGDRPPPPSVPLEITTSPTTSPPLTTPTSPDSNDEITMEDEGKHQPPPPPSPPPNTISKRSLGSGYFDDDKFSPLLKFPPPAVVVKTGGKEEDNNDECVNEGEDRVNEEVDNNIVSRRYSGVVDMVARLEVVEVMKEVPQLEEAPQFEKEEVIIGGEGEEEEEEGIRRKRVVMLEDKLRLARSWSEVKLIFSSSSEEENDESDLIKTHRNLPGILLNTTNDNGGYSDILTRCSTVNPSVISGAIVEVLSSQFYDTTNSDDLRVTLLLTYVIVFFPGGALGTVLRTHLPKLPPEVSRKLLEGIAGDRRIPQGVRVRIVKEWENWGGGEVVGMAGVLGSVVLGDKEKENKTEGRRGVGDAFRELRERGRTKSKDEENDEGSIWEGILNGEYK